MAGSVRLTHCKGSETSGADPQGNKGETPFSLSSAQTLSSVQRQGVIVLCCLVCFRFQRGQMRDASEMTGGQ